MPRKILASQRKHFWRLYQAQGHTIEEASRRAGFSLSYGKKLIREGIGAPPVGASSNDGREKIARADDAELLGRPKREHELSPIAADCLKDFGRFRARYLGSMTLPWQEEAAELVISHLASEDDSYGVVNAPQGSGKTRLFTHDIPAWLTVRDRSIRGCLGSGTKPISARMTGNLRATLARKSPVVAAERWKSRGMARDADATLAADYGRFKPIMPGIQWTREEFTVEGYWEDRPAGQAELAEYLGEGQDKEATWAAFSHEAQVMSLRFDFMNWDDLHTHRQLRNPDIMQDLFDWWDVEAESRLDPGGLCLVTMQRLGSNDISRYLLDKIDPAFEIDADRDTTPRQYFHVIYKAHYDDKCEGQHGKDAPAYPAGCMLDPRRITDQKINAKKVGGNYEVVYQQEDTDPAGVLVEKAWVYGGIASDGTEHESLFDTDRSPGQLPRVPPGAFTVRYMTVDPSPTKFWSIQDWLYVLPVGADPMAGYRYLLDMRRDKMGANDFLDYSHSKGGFVGLAEEWVRAAREMGCPISHLIMEKNAAQRWAMQYDFFQQWKHARFVQVIPHETMSNKADPELGVWATIPGVWNHGLVRLPGADSASKAMSYPLVREVTTYPNGATDDCVMSEWFGEYNLQHLVARRQSGARVHTNIPSWLRER